MVLWFTGTAMIAMWFTFRDPAIDHRFVIVGALIPEVVSAFSAQASFTHNLFTVSYTHLTLPTKA